MITDFGCENYLGIYANENADVKSEWAYYRAAERDAIIEESHSGKVSTVNMSMQALESKLLAGNNDIDFVVAPYGAVDKSNCYNLYDLGLDFSEAWWHGDSAKNMTADGVLYGAVPCFMLESMKGLSAMFFSMDALEKVGLKQENIHDLAYENKWTLDAFFEISKKAAGKLTYGFVCEENAISALYFGAGQRYLTKSEGEDGKTTFSHGFNDAASAVTDKLIGIFGDSSTKVLAADKIKEALKNGDALFTVGTIRDLSEYSEAKKWVGVMPMPTVDGKQKTFYSTTERESPMVFALKTAKKPELVGDFLWLYSYYSYRTVYSTFVHIYRYSYTTDAQSGDMIYYILISATYDFAYLNDWAGVNEKYISYVLAGENRTEDEEGGAMPAE